MTRLMVTGASGLLGANIVLEAMGTHQVVAVSRRYRLETAEVTARQADLAEAATVRALVTEMAPEWIIHCAAATDVDQCERDPEHAMRLNRDMAAHVASAAAAQQAALVFISTDAVFDGSGGDYDETSEAHPLSAYGRTKHEGELAVQRLHPHAIIVRTNIYGWNATPERSLAEWFLQRCESGQRSPGWSDVTSTPILVNDLAGILLRLLASGAAGLYHVGGATCLSKHEFGRRVATTFGFDPELIQATSVEQAGLAAPRAHRLCLRGAKVEHQLGLSLPTVDEGLARFRRMREDGAVRRLKGLLAGGGSDPGPAAREDRTR